jgi:hypothetical protein
MGWCKSFGTHAVKFSGSIVMSYMGNKFIEQFVMDYTPQYVFVTKTHLRKLVDQMKHSAMQIVEDDPGVLAQFDYHRAAMTPFCYKLADQLEFVLGYLDYTVENTSQSQREKTGCDSLAPYLLGISNQLFERVYACIGQKIITRAERDELVALLEEYDNELTALINRCVLLF